MMRSDLNFPFSLRRVWYSIKRALGLPVRWQPANPIPPLSSALGTPNDSVIPPTFPQPQTEESFDMKQYAKLSHAQATTLRLARGHANDADRKGVKKEIYAAVKEAYGIPQGTKLLAEVDPAKPDYAKLRNSKTRDLFELDPTTGRWNGSADPARVQVPSSWFCLPADKLKQALIDAIESAMDGQAETYDSDDLEGLGAKKLNGGGIDVALDDAGNAYVYLPNDQFAPD